MIPFGKAKTVREGTDLSIITYGALVQRSVVAAKQAEQQGISVEIIDLRSRSPYDWDAIVDYSQENEPSNRGARRLFVVWVRRRDRRAHC